jgi:hypothetical protein
MLEVFTWWVYSIYTMNVASIASNKIQVEYSAMPGDNREFLTFKVPNGWDDVKLLTNKVLTHNSKDFTFSGWNSDKLECYFVRLINGPSFVASIR